MKIKTVHIKNFRALQDVEIEFDSVTTFIGPNGVGKSTVLRALEWFFNSTTDSLAESDCSHGRTSESIEVRVTFAHLTQDDKNALGKYSPLGATLFTAWKTHPTTGDEYLSANTKGYKPFESIKSEEPVSEKKVLYAGIREREPLLGLPVATTKLAIDQAIAEWEANHPNDLEDVPENLRTDFFGFNGNGQMSDLFNYILVSADLRASEQAQDAKGSVIGQILERSIDRSAADGEIAQIVEASRRAQQVVFDEKFKPELGRIAARLTEVVKSYSAGREVEISPAGMVSRPTKTSFNLAIRDGLTATEVEGQGHGFQRALLVASLQVLAESKNTNSNGVICLAIEEPELFQHPTQAQGFARVLRSLAEDPEKKMQVTYATHSQYFVEAQKFHQLRRLVRTEESRPAITINSATINSVHESLKEIKSENQVMKELDGVISHKLTSALFATRAILVEGATDAAVLYGISDREGIGILEAEGVSIVEVGGKTLIPLAHAILTALGIPTYAMFDGDKGCKPKDRDQNVKANTTNQKYFNIDPTDFPTTQVWPTVAILECNLEEYLTSHWPTWSESLAILEQELGMSLHKNQAAYRTATVRANGDPPELLTEVLQKITSR